MPLPDLTTLLTLADAAPAATTATPPPTDWDTLGKLALNLGGWATILWSLALAALRRLEQFGNDVTASLNTVAKETRGLRRDLHRDRRRLRRTRPAPPHDPPSPPPPHARGPTPPPA